MTITDALLTKGAEHGRNGIPLRPQGILVHYVANAGSRAINNRAYFENGSGGLNVSAHYIIGLDGEVLLCVPENEQAAHSNKPYGNFAADPALKAQAALNNSRYIGIENHCKCRVTDRQLETRRY